MGPGAAVPARGRETGAACAVPRCILFLPLWCGSSIGSNSRSGTIMGSIRYATGSNCTEEGDSGQGSCSTCLTQDSSGSYTYGVEDVEEAFAGGQAVVGIDALHSSHCEKHPDGRAKGKEDGGLVVQLGVVCRDLGEGDVQICS